MPTLTGRDMTPIERRAMLASTQARIDHYSESEIRTIERAITRANTSLANRRTQADRDRRDNDPRSRKF